MLGMLLEWPKIPPMGGASALSRTNQDSRMSRMSVIPVMQGIHSYDSSEAPVCLRLVWWECT